MDRFLFQGKSQKSGEWVTGYLVHGNLNNLPSEILTLKTQDGVDDCGEPFYKSDDACIPIVEGSIGQCTGSEDKNDKLIFEGNIIKISLYTDNTKQKLILEDFASVIWQGCSWGVLWGERKEFTRLDAFCNFDFEVVGNIHEGGSKCQQNF